MENIGQIISEIRSQLRQGTYGSAQADMQILMNELDRRETRKPDSLQFMRDSIKAGRYPHHDDILALIDELEASRAAHIEDLEYIDKLLARNFRGADFVNDSMAARGVSVARFVRARLESRRNPEQASVIEILEEINRELEPLTAPNVMVGVRQGACEARRIVRRKIEQLKRANHE